MLLGQLFNRAHAQCAPTPGRTVRLSVGGNYLIFALQQRLKAFSGTGVPAKPILSGLGLALDLFEFVGIRLALFLSFQFVGLALFFKFFLQALALQW